MSGIDEAYPNQWGHNLIKLNLIAHYIDKLL